MVLADDARGYRRDQSGPERVGDTDRIHRTPATTPVITIPALSAADPRYLRLAFGERASKYCLNPGRRSVSNEVNAVPAQTPRTTGRYPRPPTDPEVDRQQGAGNTGQGRILQVSAIYYRPHLNVWLPRRECISAAHPGLNCCQAHRSSGSHDGLQHAMRSNRKSHRPCPHQSPKEKHRQS